MQAGMFILVLTTTAYAPLELLQGWLAGHRPDQPADPGRRRGPPGLRRRASPGPRPGRAAGRSPGCWRVLGCFALRGMRRARRLMHPRPSRTRSTARRALPSGSCAELAAEGERRGVPLLLHPPEPQPLPVAVVLGLLLRRDRLAALRARALARLSSRACSQRDAPGRLHRPRRSSGTSRSAAAPRLLQRHLAPRRDDRDDPAAAARLGLEDRRRRPGRGAADRRPSTTGCARTATSRATACSGSSSPTSRGSTPRRSSTRSGAGAQARRLRLSAAGRAQPPARLGRAPDPRPRLAGALRDDDQHALVASSLHGRWASPRSRRPWSTGSGTSAAASSSTRPSPAARGPASRTWAALAPLALPDLPEEIGRRLVEEHLLEPERSTGSRSRRPRSPPPSPATSPTAARPGSRRYWRGPTWVNSAWMRLARHAPARLRGRRPSAWPSGVIGAVAARGPARVLRPAHRQGPGRHGLRLVGPDRRAGRPDQRLDDLERLARTQGARRGERTPVRDPKASDRGRRQALICSGR